MGKKKTAWEQSKFGQLKLVDLYNAIFIAMLTVLDNIAEIFYSGEYPDIDTLKWNVGIFIAIIIFKFFSNSEGKFAKPEPK